MREIRVFYTKLGDARLISHLDMNRVFLRAVNRTDIPIWYTQGYNPHPYFSFSLPLSLGVESECESFDMRLDDDEYPIENVKSEFNRVLPGGIQIVSVGIPKMKAKDIYCGIFEAAFKTPRADSLFIQVEKILKGGELTAVKKQKSGKKKVEAQVNILQGVITYTISKQKDTVKLKLLLLSGIKMNTNPVLLVNSLKKACSSEIEDVKIRKIALFDEKYRDFC